MQIAHKLAYIEWAFRTADDMYYGKCGRAAVRDAIADVDDDAPREDCELGAGD